MKGKSKEIFPQKKHWEIFPGNKEIINQGNFFPYRNFLKMKSLRKFSIKNSTREFSLETRK